MAYSYQPRVVDPYYANRPPTVPPSSRQPPQPGGRYPGYGRFADESPGWLDRAIAANRAAASGGPMPNTEADRLDSIAMQTRFRQGQDPMTGLPMEGLDIGPDGRVNPFGETSTRAQQIAYEARDAYNNSVEGRGQQNLLDLDRRNREAIAGPAGYRGPGGAGPMYARPNTMLPNLGQDQGKLPQLTAEAEAAQAERKLANKLNETEAEGIVAAAPLTRDLVFQGSRDPQRIRQYAAQKRGMADAARDGASVKLIAALDPGTYRGIADGGSRIDSTKFNAARDARKAEQATRQAAVRINANVRKYGWRSLATRNAMLAHDRAEREMWAAQQRRRAAQTATAGAPAGPTYAPPGVNFDPAIVGGFPLTGPLNSVL